uniref:Spliceosome-associated protein CWC27 homolog n=1 Tax=Falco tinnunculus TaxID=100819 RepID=A0A8C4XTX9_FALTI
MSNIYIQEPPTNGKVLLRTTAGDIDIELWSKEAPKACRNFIQLCMEEYYNNTIFHRVVPGFIVQGGDPTGTGSGGESIYGAPFKDEFHSRLRFNRRGLVAMANAGPHDNGSQFFFTLGRADELNSKHTIFGKVTGDTIYNMLRLAEVEVDKEERPLSPHKIRSSEVLFNPFDDIVPRPNRKLKKDKPEEETRKSKVKGTKNFNLLSFGEEAEEEEEEVSRVSQSMKGKSKSSHDLLKDDPHLSSVPAVKSEEASEEKDLSEEEEDHDEDADSVEGEAASDERFQMKERIAKKLKIDTSENAKQQLQEEETKSEKKTTSRRYCAFHPPTPSFSLFTVRFSAQFQFCVNYIDRLVLHANYSPQVTSNCGKQNRLLLSHFLVSLGTLSQTVKSHFVNTEHLLIP